MSTVGLRGVCVPANKTFIRAVNSSGARAERGPLGATAPLCNPRKAKTVPCARILKRSRDSKRPELRVCAHPVNSAAFSRIVRASIL